MAAKFAKFSFRMEGNTNFSVQSMQNIKVKKFVKLQRVLGSLLMTRCIFAEFFFLPRFLQHD